MSSNLLCGQNSAHYTVKTVIGFLSLAGTSLTKLSLAGNYLIIPGQGEFGYSDILSAGREKR